MHIVVLDHPLAASSLTKLRDIHTDRATFRRELHQLATYVIYEALRQTPTVPVQVQTPLALTDGVRLAAPPVIVPVLRAGLGMLNAALTLSPDSLVGFVGAKRNEETYFPETYLNALPEDLSGYGALIIDPMLATGGSLVDCIDRVSERNPARILVASIIAAPEGVAAIEAQGRTDVLVTATIDAALDQDRYIVPGLGDAGDRQFGLF